MARVDVKPAINQCDCSIACNSVCDAPTLTSLVATGYPITVQLAATDLPDMVIRCGFSIAGHSLDLWGRDDATRKACAAHNITYSACTPRFDPNDRWKR